MGNLIRVGYRGGCVVRARDRKELNIVAIEGHSWESGGSEEQQSNVCERNYPRCYRFFVTNNRKCQLTLAHLNDNVVQVWGGQCDGNSCHAPEV